MSTVLVYDPVGWGLPYSGYFSGGSEEDLVDIAVQVLCAILDFSPSSHKNTEANSKLLKDKSDVVEAVEANGVEASNPKNVYRNMLQNISRETEIDLIFAGIVRLLSTVHQADQTYLPNSRLRIGFYQEALVLLWHLITTNRAFLTRISENLNTNSIVLPVLYLIQQAHNSPPLAGLLHTASFVLLVLSAERSFCVRLNLAYSTKIPLQLPPFEGCHADALTLTLYRIVSDSLPKPQNDALVEMLLTVLCNISPYVKSFALESGLKLLSLLERCCRPGYFLRSANAHHGVLNLVEMLDNIIQYQYEGNAMLAYSIIRHKELFHMLCNIQLPDTAPVTSSAEQWVPTAEWLDSWKRSLTLPVNAIACLIDHLIPKIEALCRENDGAGQEEIVKMLQATTVVGILPQPHPIVIRTYRSSSYTSMWFSSYLWGIVFTRSQRLPLYDWTKIRLVMINH